jgi:hypothetical protein
MGKFSESLLGLRNLWKGSGRLRKGCEFSEELRKLQMSVGMFKKS